MKLIQIEVGFEGTSINQRYEHLHNIAVDTWLTHTWKFTEKAE